LGGEKKRPKPRCPKVSGGGKVRHQENEPEEDETGPLPETRNGQLKKGTPGKGVGARTPSSKLDAVSLRLQKRGEKIQTKEDGTSWREIALCTHPSLRRVLNISIGHG